MESKANNDQVGGSHYKDNKIQPWDFIIANKLGFLEGNIIKYVVRYAKKGGVEDLQKAQHYLDKLKETQEDRFTTPYPKPTEGASYGPLPSISSTTPPWCLLHHRFCCEECGKDF